MSERGWSLVCYDIRDDKRLRKAAKLLEGYGERIQYSIFRVRLSPRDEQKLRWELARLLEGEDSWLIIPLCAACVAKLRRHDASRSWPDEPTDFVIV